MYTSNNQISGRQVTRLLTFDLLSYSALMIPATLAREAGRDGIFSIVLGVLAGFLYLGILKCLLSKVKGSYTDYLTEQCGTFVGGLLKIGYLIYFLVFAGKVAVTFARLVEKELLEQRFPLILVILMLLTFYGVTGGIEGRARVYEILFWIVLLPLLGMMVFTIPEIDADYWQPIFYATKEGVVRGGYETFMGCSILFLLPFLVEFVKKRENLTRCGGVALLLTGGILLLLYLVLLGLFGSEALATIEYPAVTMMSRVQITGGFLKRIDAIMFGIWFFTLYALLNSLVFFGGKLWENLAKSMINEAGWEHEQGKKVARIGMLLQTLLVYFLANRFYQSEVMDVAAGKFLRYVGVPYIVLVPVFLLLRSSTLIQKTVSCLLLCGCLFLNGCGATEVENREFPVLLEIKNEENFSKEWLNSLQKVNKKVDYNHLKIILITQDFLENEAAMSEMLSLLKQDKNVPLNAYVVTCGDTEELLGTEEKLEEPLGNYIEKLLENSDEITKETFPTIGLLYQEKENQVETLFIPYIGVRDEKPMIMAYEAYKGGSARGLMETDSASLAFFIANQMEEYTLQLGLHNYVQLSKTKNHIQFEEHIEESGLIKKRVMVEISCEGEIIQEKISGAEDEVRNLLTLQLKEYMEAKTREALKRGIDLTNSRKKLGGAMRGWYERYKDAPELYEEEIEIIFNYNIKWVK